MLQRVALGDLADVLGLRSGDLLVNVNGHDLGTANEQLAAYSELQGESLLALTVERGGELLRITYVIDE